MKANIVWWKNTNRHMSCNRGEMARTLSLAWSRICSEFLGSSGLVQARAKEGSLNGHRLMIGIVYKYAFCIHMASNIPICWEWERDSRLVSSHMPRTAMVNKDELKWIGAFCSVPSSLSILLRSWGSSYDMLALMPWILFKHRVFRLRPHAFKTSRPNEKWTECWVISRFYVTKYLTCEC